MVQEWHGKTPAIFWESKMAKYTILSFIFLPSMLDMRRRNEVLNHVEYYHLQVVWNLLYIISQAF